jgi:hypothetical protein
MDRLTHNGGRQAAWESAARRGCTHRKGQEGLQVVGAAACGVYGGQRGRSGSSTEAHMRGRRRRACGGGGSDVRGRTALTQGARRRAAGQHCKHAGCSAPRTGGSAPRMLGSALCSFPYQFKPRACCCHGSHGVPLPLQLAESFFRYRGSTLGPTRDDPPKDGDLVATTAGK